MHVLSGTSSGPFITEDIEAKRPQSLHWTREALAKVVESYDAVAELQKCLKVQPKVLVELISLLKQQESLGFVDDVERLTFE